MRPSSVRSTGVEKREEAESRARASRDARDRRGKMEERQNPPIAVRNGKTLEDPTRLFDVVREGDSGELVHARVYRQVRRLGCARPRVAVKRRSLRRAPSTSDGRP